MFTGEDFPLPSLCLKKPLKPLIFQGIKMKMWYNYHMEKYTVYQHKNKKNGRAYKTCPRFFDAIEKYGWDSFEHIIIKDGLSKEDAIALEMKLIKELRLTDSKFGYNLTTGGEHYLHNDETKKKMSARRRAMKGKTPEHIREAISKGLKGNTLKPPKAVNQYSLVTGELIQTFPSLTDAANSVGASIGNLSLACRHKRKVVKGYAWMFAQENVDRIDPVDYDTSEFVNGKKVMQYTIYGDYVRTYKNIAEASRVTGISAATISSVCCKRGNTAGKYCWIFAKEME